MRLIDADAIPYETHYVPDGETEWEYKEEQCVCKSSIDEMPTIEARPVVRGEWEKRTTIIFDDEIEGYHCAFCNTTWDAATNFCPNCAADLRIREVTE